MEDGSGNRYGYMSTENYKELVGIICGWSNGNVNNKEDGSFKKGIFRCPY